MGSENKAQGAPDKKGQLLIKRSLLIELSAQQGKGGDFLVDISAWEGITKTGKAIINLKIEKPKKFGQEPAQQEPELESHEVEVLQEPQAIAPVANYYLDGLVGKPKPAPTKPQYTAEDIARGKLKKFKILLGNCKSLQDVIDLEHQLHEPDRW